MVNYRAREYRAREQFRIFGRLHSSETITIAESREDLEDCYGLDADRLFQYLPGSAEEITLAEHLALWWLGVVETYLAAIARGLPITALRFKDLTQQPDAVLAKVFEMCGLGDVDPGKARPAFLQDAQAGTVLERERPGEAHLRLSANQIAAVRAVVARHPLVSAYIHGRTSIDAPAYRRKGLAPEGLPLMVTPAGRGDRGTEGVDAARSQHRTAKAERTKGAAAKQVRDKVAAAKAEPAKAAKAADGPGGRRTCCRSRRPQPISTG